MPASNGSLGARELLRAIGLATVGLAVVLLVRNALKPPQDRSAAGLVMLVVFIAANGLPLLMSLKLPASAVPLRVAAIGGVVLDVLVAGFMALYLLLTAKEGFTALRIRAALFGIGGPLLCGLVLLFRPRSRGDR